MVKREEERQGEAVEEQRVEGYGRVVEGGKGGDVAARNRSKHDSFSAGRKHEIGKARRKKS